MDVEQVPTVKMSRSPTCAPFTRYTVSRVRAPWADSTRSTPLSARGGTSEQRVEDPCSHQVAKAHAAFEKGTASTPSCMPCLNAIGCTLASSSRISGLTRQAGRRAISHILAEGRGAHAAGAGRTSLVASGDSLRNRTKRSDEQCEEREA